MNLAAQNNNPHAPDCARNAFLRRRAPAIGLLIVAVVFFGLAALTWRKWPDIIVDFGAQLYIPWRLSRGAVLYRDLFYFASGPLSQYYNALLFKIFGVGFLTLILSNLVLAAGVLLLIYRRFVAAADAITATLIGLAIVVVFAFASYLTIGNYNYIAPYSFEAVHGLFLSILAIALLADWINKKQLLFAALAGLCVGMVFLTKPDIFIALSMSVLAAFVLARATGGGPAHPWRALVAFLAAGLVAPVGFFLYFLRVEGARQSLRSLIFAWLPVFNKAVVASAFYKWCLGLDHPLRHLAQIALYSIALAAVATLYAILFIRRAAAKSAWLRSPVTLLALIAPLLAWAFCADWTRCGFALPLLDIGACVLSAWQWKKSRDSRLAFPFLWSVFGLAALAKMGLYPRVWHYGFVLAMPAFVAGIFLLFWLLPARLQGKSPASARDFRLAVLLVLLAAFARLFAVSESVYARKQLPVGGGPDKIIAFGSPDARGPAFRAALDWIENNTPANATLAVLPEGITLNFLARRVNPTPCLSWDPNMMIVFGQARMTAAFEAHPPDYVVLIERNQSEFDTPEFGHSGYGQALMQWVTTNYSPVFLIGHPPLQNGRFGIQILRRRPAQPPPAPPRDSSGQDSKSSGMQTGL